MIFINWEIIFANSIKRHIYEVLDLRLGARFISTIKQQSDLVISREFYFCKTSHMQSFDMRSFAKIKYSRKFQNLQYSSKNRTQHGYCLSTNLTIEFVLTLIFYKNHKIILNNDLTDLTPTTKTCKCTSPQSKISSRYTFQQTLGLKIVNSNSIISVDQSINQNARNYFFPKSVTTNQTNRNQ